MRWVLLWVVADLIVLPFERHHPFLFGSWLGGSAVAALPGGYLGLMFLDGTLTRRYGCLIEEAVGDDLREAPGVWAVISNVPFDGFDVDHLVIARSGVYAVEVKTISPLAAYKVNIPALAQQSTVRLRSVRIWLKQQMGVVVHPMLILAGLCQPDVPASGVWKDGCLVVGWNRSDCWSRRFGREERIDEATARRIYQLVNKQREKRWKYEAQQRTRGRLVRNRAAA